MVSEIHKLLKVKHNFLKVHRYHFWSTQLSNVPPVWVLTMYALGLTLPGVLGSSSQANTLTKYLRSLSRYLQEH